MATDCVYHPIYRSCRNCGSEMERNEKRECVVRAPSPEELRPLEVICDALKKEGRSEALREARALILLHAQLTHKGGLTERSDGITEVLVDFDLKFPEGREPW